MQNPNLKSGQSILYFLLDLQNLGENNEQSNVIAEKQWGASNLSFMSMPFARCSIFFDVFLI